MRPSTSRRLDVEHVEQRDLAGLVGALGLALLDFERRHDVGAPGVERLLGLGDANAGRPHVGDHLRARGRVQLAGALDLRRGARDRRPGSG